MKKYESVDHYFNELDQWTDENQLLREILNSCVLVETLKWSIPMYTYNGKNVVGLFSSKKYVGLWFIQGSFLSDPYRILVNAENRTRGQRQWRFQSIDEIDPIKVRSYLMEAIQNEKEGRRIKPVKNTSLEVPEILQVELNKNKELELKFHQFTLAKKREFTQHISSAKQQVTQVKRLQKCIPLILKGEGLNDKYRK